MTNAQASNLSSTLLFITFLVLKLTHVIAWSRWWITAPLWGPAAFFGSIAIFCFGMAILTGQWPKKKH